MVRPTDLTATQALALMREGPLTVAALPRACQPRNPRG